MAEPEWGWIVSGMKARSWVLIPWCRLLESDELCCGVTLRWIDLGKSQHLEFQQNQMNPLKNQYLCCQSLIFCTLYPKYWKYLLYLWPIWVFNHFYPKVSWKIHHFVLYLYPLQLFISPWWRSSHFFTAWWATLQLIYWWTSLAENSANSSVFPVRYRF